MPASTHLSELLFLEGEEVCPDVPAIAVLVQFDERWCGTPMQKLNVTHLQLVKPAKHQALYQTQLVTVIITTCTVSSSWFQYCKPFIRRGLVLPNIESKKFSVCLFERDDFDKPLVQPEDDAASLRVYYSLHATLAVFA